LFYGGPGLFFIQLKATLVTGLYSFLVSWGLLKLTDLLVGLRVTDTDERIGLDLTQHRESAYTLID